MATLVLPDQFKPGALPDVWQALTAELAKAKPGDVVLNPYPDVVWPCDRTIEFKNGDKLLNGVRCEWEGATIQQRTERPFGQTRSDVSIVNGRHFFIPAGSPLIPTSCDYGWIDGPGIDPGTHIKLDRNRRGGTLEQDCVDGTGLPVVFTSQQDRSRAAFRDSGKDNQNHNVTTIGPNADPDFEPTLEAQHGFDFAGATNPLLVGVKAYRMQGDGFYPGALGSRITTYLSAVGGVIDNCARSAFSPVNCAHTLVDQYVFDHIGRTIINIEPPNSGCITDDLKVTRSIIGKHQLYLLSSGGNAGATVGRVELSDCWMVNDDGPLRLVKGSAGHKRGPYFVLRNRSTYGVGFGASFPTSALIAIDNANSGSEVIDNKGFKLQAGRGMAFCRFRNSGTVEVRGNDHDGGIEVGPWI